MRTKAAQISLTVICLFVGIMLVTQFRTQTKIQRSILAEPATNQALIIDNLYANNVALRKEVGDLQTQMEQYDRSSERSDLTAMASELNRMRVATGLSEVSGPGVELTVIAPLTAEDVRDLINEFRNTGAEAVAVNDQRVVAQSAVSAVQGILYLNAEPIASPYMFVAIGHPDTIEGALLRKGGVLAIVQTFYPDGQFSVSKRDKVILPVYRSGYQWVNARPADK